MVESKSQAVEGGEKEKICWQCGRAFTTVLEVCPDDGARLIEMGVEDRADPLIGSLFDGRFRIFHKLGEGGMGAVYSARRLDFETEVALKLLKSDFARDEGIRKRFMYEARVISNLKHPHAVRLFDFGQTSDGHVYMVMELLKGESLADRLAYRFVTYQEIFDIIAPVCGVLGEAHMRDVVHRDLKPENIYLLKVEGNHEFPKLLDFGIAKHNRAETMTKSGTLWGTPAYMSPEQARGDQVGGPADIYAIGIMLFELISGNLPFHASTQMGFAVKHINEQARPLLSIPGLHSVPQELDDFIMSMLAKRVEERPKSMDEVAQTLLRIRDEYFDEELLASIPAEEVDPVGLQRWMSEAPDISQNLPAERERRDIDAHGATQEGERVRTDSPTVAADADELAVRAVGVAPSEMMGEKESLGRVRGEGAKKEGAPTSRSGWQRARPFVFMGVLIGVAVAVGLFAIFGSLMVSNESDGSAEAIFMGSEVSEIVESPLDTQSVVGAATMRAAHVMIEARGVIAEMGRAKGEGLTEEELDFLNLSEGAQEQGIAEDQPSDDDARIREALEQTF